MTLHFRRTGQAMMFDSNPKHARARGRRASDVSMTVGLAAAVLLGVCGGNAGAAASSAAHLVAMTTGGSPNATGCGTPRPSGTLTPTVAGHPRVVLVHVPNGYSGAAKVPLVLNMHGSGSTAAEQEAFTGMDATADAEGFIVAYPQALLPDRSGFDWNVPGVARIGDKPVPKDAANDVEFLTRLVGALEQRYCIDPSRVYATGFSGGARISSQLACDASNTFAAVAPVSGLRHPTPCPATRPVPIIALHGTADPVDPYGGHGQAYWTYSVPQAAADWARQDRCSPSGTSHVGAGFTLVVYDGCGDGSAVELYSITGEGHEWPGGPPLRRKLTRVLGPQSSAVDADTTMWMFFAAHPLPPSVPAR